MQPYHGNSTRRFNAVSVSSIESLLSMMHHTLLQNQQQLQLIKELSERKSGRTPHLKKTLPSQFTGAQGTDSTEEWTSRYTYLCDQNGLKTDKQKVEAY